MFNWTSNPRLEEILLDHSTQPSWTSRIQLNSKKHVNKWDTSTLMANSAEVFSSTSSSSVPTKRSLLTIMSSLEIFQKMPSMLIFIGSFHKLETSRVWRFHLTRITLPEDMVSFASRMRTPLLKLLSTAKMMKRPWPWSLRPRIKIPSGNLATISTSKIFQLIWRKIKLKDFLRHSVLLNLWFLKSTKLANTDLSATMIQIIKSMDLSVHRKPLMD